VLQKGDSVFGSRFTQNTARGKRRYKNALKQTLEPRLLNYNFFL